MFRAVSSLFNLFRKVEPVDRIIPWVNSIDPEYMNDREKYYESADNSIIRLPDINNNELELKTAILYIIKNIDWKGTKKKAAKLIKEIWVSFRLKNCSP